MSAYEDYLAKLRRQQDEQQKLQNSLRDAATVNPDSYADQLSLARAASIAVEAVPDYEELAKQNRLLTDVGVGKLIESAPKASKFLMEPGKAKLSSDAIKNLEEMEKQFGSMKSFERSWWEGITDPFMFGFKGFEKNVVARQADSVYQGIAQIQQDVAKSHGINTDPQMDYSIRMAELQRRTERYAPPLDIAEGLQKINSAQSFGEFFGAVAENPWSVKEGILQSLGMYAPILATTVATRGLVSGGAALPFVSNTALAQAGTLGAGSFLIEYGSTMDNVMAEAGVDLKDPYAVHAALQNPELMSEAKDRAVKRGLSIALFDALTGAVAGKLLSRAKPTAVSVGSRVVGEAAIQAAGGAAGEATAQIVSGEEFTLGAVLFEALAEIPTTAIEVPGNYKSTMEQAYRAEQIGKVIDNLKNLSTANKVRTRDANTWSEWLNQLKEDVDVENLYIGAGTLRQSGVAEQIAQSSPEVAKQLATAADGDEIRIPISEFLTNVGTSDAASAIIDDLRVEGETMTRREAQVVIERQAEEFQAALDKQAQKAMADDAFIKSARAVENNIFGQIKATGVYTDTAARSYANLVRDWYTVQAAQMKNQDGSQMTPEQLYQMLPYQVATDQAMPTARLFSQDGEVITTSPAFDAFYGASVFRDEAGNPQLLYHGTADNVTAFDVDHPNRKDSGYLGTGVYLTDSVDMAEIYAQQKRRTGEAGENVMPLYARLENPYMATEEDRARVRAGGREAADAFTAELQAQGYDGVIYQAAPDAREIVVFDPAAVKSQFNDGTWSDSDNLLSQRGRGQQEGRVVPTTIDQLANVASAFEFASTQSFKTNREFKVALQNRVLEAAKQAKIDLSQFTVNVERYLVRVATMDALTALETNPNAVGWYNEKVTKALRIISLIHPEVATDREAKFAFTWALAVTSNGLKVDKNFELAERAYRSFKETGRMPTNIQAGQAQIAINESLGLYNDLVDQYGIDRVIDFMTTRQTVKNVVAFTGKNVSGENLTTEVYGAAALGPKIGNGFFANLYGQFEQLTMDRWLMRTWGRWTATLVDDNKAQAKVKRDQLKSLIKLLSPDQKKQFEAIIKTKLAVGKLDEVSLAINKASLKPANRQAMAMIGNSMDDAGQAALAEIFGPLKRGQQRVSLGDEMRKTGNALAKYLDGQKEAPSGPPERARIRQVMGQVLTELQQTYPDLTMSDLQALLWYPEKRLYDSAKTADEGQTGYEDDEAPDYANAAAALAQELGVSREDIERTIQEVDNELSVRAAQRTARAERGAGDGILRQGARERAAINFDDAEVTRYIEENGGVTLNRDGSFFSADSGYIATIRSINVASLEEVPEAIRAFAQENANLLAMPDVVIGGFAFDGGVSIDLNIVTQDRDLAVKIGTEMGQISVWDIANSEEIKTGGTSEQGMTNAQALEFIQSLGGDYEQAPGGIADTGMAQDGLEPAAGRAGGGAQPLRAESLGITQSYGTARDGSTRVTGIHYSREPRTSLAGRFYGTGIRGAESQRLAATDDQRIRSRIYFYVDEGNGVRPESGVGQNVHGVILENLYDLSADPLGLRAQIAASGMNLEGDGFSALESAVIDAGFDGIYAPQGQGNQGVVVLLGDHAVQVEQKGTHQMQAAGAVQPAAPARQGYSLLSSEIRQFNEQADQIRAVAPSVELTAGRLTFDPSEAAALSQFFPGIKPLQQTAGTVDDILKQSAFHGSPYRDIIKLSVENIGTGTGTQNFGWGLYFADRQEGAEAYRQSEGQTYRVEIPDDDVLLDWDKPLSEQPEKVRAVIDQAIAALDEEGQQFIRGRGDKNKGFNLYNALTVSSNIDGARGASMLLNSLGIKGIKYQSRQAEAGNFNFVVFDADATTILDTFYQLQGQTGQQGPRGGFDPSRLTTILTKRSDYSTFLHETGHFYLEAMFRLAAMPQATQRMREDAQTVLDWFGVKDLNEWNSLSLDEQRKHHEAWAYNFEIYAFDGKAPSVKLQTLFDRFAAWLRRVYTSIRDELNAIYKQENGVDLPILTGEVRQVMDRMLASESQIKQAETVRNMVPLYQTQEESGMDDATWAAYQALMTEATDASVSALTADTLRQMKWLSNARGRKLKEMQKQADEIRKDMRGQVAKEVENQPIYRAIRWLRFGEMTTPDGEEIKADAGFKLNLDDVKALYPESGLADVPDYRKLGYGKTGMLSKTGLSPDVVAEIFGFTSGDQMIRALIDAPSLKEAIDSKTDQRMLEEYSELSDPKAMSIAVERALHNEARARFVAAELRHASKATAPVRVMLDAAKQAAKRIIEGKLVRETKPSEYTAAETRATRMAEQAMREGKAEEVTRALQNRLLNNQLAREAGNASEEIEKGLRYLRKVLDDKNRQRMGADFADQIATLLERYELKPISLKEIDKRTSLAQWLQSQRDAGIEPVISPQLEYESGLKSYKNMTVAEFRDLVDAVKQIEHLGKNDQRMLTAAKRVAYETARDEIVESINANARGRVSDARTPTTTLGRYAQGLKRFWASHIKAATIARVLDGGKDGGPMWEYFIRTANERGDMETQMRAEATEALTKLMAPILAGGPMGGKGKFFPSINRSLNRESVITIALNMGNDGNIQRLLGGEGWTIDQVMPIVSSLSPAELKAVQAIWDYFESYRPMIAEKERRLYGKEPNWIEPKPVTFTANNGEQVTLKGGYYPIKYDPAASMRAESQADAEEAKRMLQGAFTSATTRRSFVKGRVEAVQGRPLLYTLAGMYSGINDVIHDLAWHEWLIDANKLMRSQQIDNAIRSQYGPEFKDQLKTWIKDVAVGEQLANNAGEMALNRLRQGVSAAGLGFNVMSAMQQITGFNQSIVRVGAKYIGRGLMKMMSEPFATIRDVNQKSSFMDNRARTQFRELNELRNMVQGETRASRAIKVGAYFMMAKMQKMVDVPTWVGAYEKAIGEGNDDARAIALADQAVIDSQGNGMMKDLSAIERGGPALKLFTAYYSYMNTVFQLTVGQTMTAKSKGKLAADYLMLFIAPVVGTMLLKSALTPGGDDDEWDMEKIARSLGAETLSYLMGTMVVLRELSETSKLMFGAEEGARDYSGPAGLRVISDAIKFSKQASQLEFDDAFRKSAINLLGSGTGLPAAQINRTINGVQALVEGETQNPAAILLGVQK